MKSKVPDRAGVSGGTVVGQPFDFDGRLRPRNPAAGDLYVGVGAPSASNPMAYPRTGSYYFRSDVQVLYACTQGGATPVWVALTGGFASHMRAHVSVNQTLAPLVNPYMVPFDTSDFDTGSNFNLGTHIYTVLVPGYYLVMAAVLLSATNQQTNFRMNFATTGTPVGLPGAVNTAPINSFENYSTQSVVKASQGDTLQLQLTSDIVGTNATLFADPDKTFLSVQYLGPA